MLLGIGLEPGCQCLTKFPFTGPADKAEAAVSLKVFLRKLPPVNKGLLKPAQVRVLGRRRFFEQVQPNAGTAEGVKKISPARRPGSKGFHDPDFLNVKPMWIVEKAHYELQAVSEPWRKLQMNQLLHMG